MPAARAALGTARTGRWVQRGDGRWVQRRRAGAAPASPCSGEHRGDIQRREREGLRMHCAVRRDLCDRLIAIVLAPAMHYNDAGVEVHDPVLVDAGLGVEQRASRARVVGTGRRMAPMLPRCRFQLDSSSRPTADQPKAIASLAAGMSGANASRRCSARRDGQDDDDGGGDPGAAAPGAGDRAQQDARGPAVQRVPDLLPGQRGRVLRLLLRLLPAGGVRPEPRSLHREGLGDQPGGGSPAPRGDGGGVRAPGRDRRRVGLLHLRPRLAGDV